MYFLKPARQDGIKETSKRSVIRFLQQHAFTKLMRTLLEGWY